MRRSEMLKLIESLIDCGREWADKATRAENLLCHLEQAGMLPPDQNANEEPPCAVLTEWEDED